MLKYLDFLKKKLEEDTNFPKEIDNFERISDVEEKPIPKEEIPKKEWIWVEGYKGTDENMCCRKFQYKLNKTYICQNEIIFNKNGFHFCKELKNVFYCYPLNYKHKFLKLKD